MKNADCRVLARLEAARETAARSGRMYAVYSSERIHVEDAAFVCQLIGKHAIGRLIQTLGMVSHRLNAPYRSAWFFSTTSMAKFCAISAVARLHCRRIALAMTQARAFKAAELCVRAQMPANAKSTRSPPVYSKISAAMIVRLSQP